MSLTASTSPTIVSSTNIGPMITPLSFPADCTTNLYDMNTPGLGVPWTYWTQGCAIASCCPSSSFYTTAWAWYSSYYSPAVCPNGYQTCSVADIIHAKPSETIAWCVLNAFSCPATTVASPYYNIMPQDTSFPIRTAVVVDNIFNQSIQSTTTVTQFYNINYPIQIRWKAGDFDNTTTITTSTAGTGWLSHAAGVTATSTPSSAPAPISGPATGLPVGTTAAIAIVAGIVVVAALVGYLVWRRRRAGVGRATKDPRRIDDKNWTGAGELETPANAHELGGDHERARAELGGRERAELGGHARSELE